MTGQSQLSTIVEMYLQKNHRLGWQARSKTRIAFDHLIASALDIPICDFKFADAEDFQDYLIRQGKTKTSVDSYIKTIRPIFKWCIRRELIAKDPWDGLKPFNEQVPIRVFNDAEVHAILRVAQDNIVWHGRIIAALSAGLRRGEVLNLRFEDCDFEKGIIHIRERLPSNLCWAWKPKNGKNRDVPLTAKLSNLMLLLKVDLPAGQPYPFLTEKRYWTLKDRIGSLPDRVKSTPDENRRPWEKIMNQAQVKGTFHDLRRTCLTRWSKSVPYQELQRLAGHSSLETTLTYYSATGADYLERARQVSNRGDWT